MDKNTAMGTLLAFIKKSKVPAKNWYVGITNDPYRRVFIEHNVPLDYQFHKAVDVPSVADARDVEAFFIQKIKTDGGQGGGESDAHFVYAFLKTETTNPSLT
jgi:hypothetical protein